MKADRKLKHVLQVSCIGRVMVLGPIRHGKMAGACRSPKNLPARAATHSNTIAHAICSATLCGVMVSFLGEELKHCPARLSLGLLSDALTSIC